MYQRAVETVEKYNMINDGDSIVVGLSGGADSCALTMFLAGLIKKYGIKITAVHINHGIRGAEADSDEAFARAFCDRLGVDFTAYHCDVPAEAKKRGIGEEEAGRLVRYEKFRETAKNIGADKIAVAHNLNDTAETLMMNLCRGSGLKGLGGIQPVSGNIIRPLIYCSRKEIEDYCTENGIEFRTDSTNLENDYTRNKIRNMLFPWLKENINPSADMNMTKTASILREEEEFLERLAERAYDEAVIERTPDRITLDARKLAKQDTVIRKRVIRSALGEIRQDTRNIGRTHTEDAEMILMGQTGKMINLPGNICVRKSYDILDIYSGREEKKEFCYDIPYGKKIYVPEMDRFVLLAEKRQSLPDNCINVYTKKIDYDKIKDRIQLRTRRKGDVLSIKGGNKKIKDIFIDDKIPAEKRDTFPLIADGNSIIAVGERLGFEYYVTDKTVKTLYIYIWEDFKNDRES